MSFKKFSHDYSEHLYVVFRVLVGLLFLQHGLQKLFGIFTSNEPVALISLMGLAGIIEFFGGIAITLGLFTRVVACITALEMLAAYFRVHAIQGWVPILNKGELALLYFAAFLILLIYGGRRWSLDHRLFRNKD